MSRNTPPVAAPSPEPASDPLSRLLQAHPHTAYDYLEFRRVMAGSAAALAAERASAADLARLRACLDAMERAHALDDPSQEAAADAEFHLAIYESAHNLVMTHVMRRVFEMLKGGVFYDRSDLYRRRGVRDGFLRQHQAIWKAVEARNPALARQAAEAHINSIEEALREAQHADARREVAMRRRSGPDLTSRVKGG
ncbi:transcriptional regulator [Paramagnetospirillum marisnigri]|uniref:Transcriptional regulator n=1 Tax=Paramagnetospirillum marisnigri TaxID=1285242 RepID=A0A178MXY3_9PROT|nr:FCD domain-containing protein [Paramagnetospirillum marisnigri]OAN55975.1 transcriptional regulator [Paramagnetospirillum marisnigri]